MISQAPGGERQESEAKKFERNTNEEKKNPIDGRKQKCHQTGSHNKEEQVWWDNGLQKVGVNDPNLPFQTIF